MNELEVFVESSRFFARSLGAFARFLRKSAAHQAPHVAPATGTGKKAPAKSERRDTARTFAKKRGNVAREGSKKAEVLAVVGSGHGKKGLAGNPTLVLCGASSSRAGGSR
jgi:hypothetical protein